MYCNTSLIYFTLDRVKKITWCGLKNTIIIKIDKKKKNKSKWQADRSIYGLCFLGDRRCLCTSCFNFETHTYTMLRFIIFVDIVIYFRTKLIEKVFFTSNIFKKDEGFIEILLMFLDVYISQQDVLKNVSNRGRKRLAYRTVQ